MIGTVVAGIVIIAVLGGGFLLGNWMNENLSGAARFMGWLIASAIGLVAVSIVVFSAKAAVSNCTDVITKAWTC